jgi:hypothetical protein
MLNRLLSLWALIFLAASAQAQVKEDSLRDAIMLRNITTAMIKYSRDFNGLLPPDLASTMPYLAGDITDTSKAIREHFTAPGIDTDPPPADATPAWINENSTYAYLGRPGILFEDVPEWSKVAIAHLKLESGHPSPTAPDNPDDQMFTVAFLDDHVELMPRAAARRVIDDSNEVLNAVQTGGPLPESYQQSHDLGLITSAVRAYAKAHADELPPDLGATLEYITKGKRTATPAQRAAVFLSARAKKTLHAPEAPTPEWVTQNASYLYLGAAAEGAPRVKLSAIEDGERTLLVCIKPEDAIDGLGLKSRPTRLYAMAPVRSSIVVSPREAYVWALAQSRKIIDSARTGSPLPDLQHTLKDLRLISQAIDAYSKDHAGMLPPDLGSTAPYLPKEAGKSASKRASVYLSAKSERLAPPPETADAAWITEHASYRYLGNAQTARADLIEGPPVELLIAPLDDGLSWIHWEIPEVVVPTADARGWIMAQPRTWVEESTPKWKEAIAAAKGRLKQK